MLIPARMRTFAKLLFEAAKRWRADNAMRLSASMALYTVLSLAPLLVITIKIMSALLGEEAATGEVNNQVTELLGKKGAEAVSEMVAESYKSSSGWTVAVVSMVVLLFSASAVFNELRDSLNTLWGIKPHPDAGWLAGIRNRFQSIGMVFVIGFLLLVSQGISIALSAAGDKILGGSSWLAILSDILLSLLVITALFTAIFRFLPDARIAWQDALMGGLVTAVLFKIGQYLQALYFTFGATGSAAGLAGSFMVVLLWIYYSCWIFFYGAEFTLVYAAWRGKPIRAEGRSA